MHLFVKSYLKFAHLDVLEMIEARNGCPESGLLDTQPKESVTECSSPLSLSLRAGQLSHNATSATM